MEQQAQTFVLVTAAERNFAMPVGQVDEVLRMAWVTAVPQSPDDVCGVLNVRGEVLAVLDPAPVLGGERGEPSASDFLVVVNLGEDRAAFKVTGVLGLAEGVPIDNPRESVAPDFVSSHVLVDGEPVPVLDATQLPTPAARQAIRRLQSEGKDEDGEHPASEEETP